MTIIRNHITIIGKMGGNTNLTHFENGKSIARFGLSTLKTERNNKGKYVRKMQWHNLFAWGPLADYIQLHAEKGKSVAVQGRLIKRTYTNRSGVEKQTTEIEVKHIVGLN